MNPERKGVKKEAAGSATLLFAFSIA